MPHRFSTDSFNMAERIQVGKPCLLTGMYTEVLTLIVILLIIQELKK